MSDANRDAEIESVVEQFEDSFNRDQPPAIEDFLRGDGDSRLLLRLTLADLELRLASRLEARAADYLQRFPQLRASRSDCLAIFAAEFRFRREVDPKLTWTAFLDRVPAEYRLGLAPWPRYEKRGEQPLGRGGQGAVWEAEDVELGRRVAIKVAPKSILENLDPGFQAEAEITARLDHPGVTPVYGLGQTSDREPAYAMKLVRWPSLQDRIDEYHQALAKGDPQAGQLLRRLVSQLEQACLTIAYAHAEEVNDGGDRKRPKQPVIHFDLKPANIKVGDFGETVVMDWGLARTEPQVNEANLHLRNSLAQDVHSQAKIDADPEATIYDKVSAGPFLIGGSRPWLSPEQASHLSLYYHVEPDAEKHELRAGPHSDVFGLGAVLYQILTGQPPYPPNDDEQSTAEGQDRYYRRLLKADFPPPAEVRGDVDPLLAAVCLKALRFHPPDRYATARAMADDLRAYLDGRDGEAFGQPWTAKTGRWLAANLAWLSALAAFALVALGLVWGVWLWQSQRAIDAKDEQVIAQLHTADRAGLSEALRIAERRPEFARSLLATLPGGGKGGFRDARLRLVRAAASRRPEEIASLLEDLGGAEKANFYQATNPAERVLLIQLLLRLATRNAVRAASNRDAYAQVIVDAEASPVRRLAAASVLAGLRKDGDSPQPSEAAMVARDLAAAGPVNIPVWCAALRGDRDELRAPLHALFVHTRDDQPEHLGAALALSLLFSNRPALLAQWIGESRVRQLPILIDALQLSGRPGAALVGDLQPAQIVTPYEGPQDAEDPTPAQAANLLLAQWRVAPQAFRWGLLEETADPRLRTELIHRFAYAEVPAERLASQLSVETRPTVAAAIMIALGQYEAHELDALPGLPSELQRRLGLADPPAEAAWHSGEHAAARWLWTTWKGRPPKSPARLKSEADLEIDRAQRVDGRTWYVNPIGQVMIVIPPPPGGEIMVGALGDQWRDKFADEPGQENNSHYDESRQTATLSSVFAIAAAETTRDQFAQVGAGDDDAPADSPDNTVVSPPGTYNQAGDGPANSLNRIEAARYCNWLSGQCGLPSYYDIAGGEVAINATGQLGYRLPTEAEWEYACRAHTITNRYYGDSDLWLDRYANSLRNSWGGPQPAARTIPNSFGLFDSLGNVWEWCEFTPGSRSQKDADVLVELRLPGHSLKPARGASFYNLPKYVRAAYRRPFDADGTRHVSIGLRVCRTLEVAVRDAPANPPEPLLQDLPE